MPLDMLIQSKPGDVVNFASPCRAGRAVVDVYAFLLVAKDLGLAVVVEAIGALATAPLIVLGIGNLPLSQEMVSAVEKNVEVVFGEIRFSGGPSAFRHQGPRRVAGRFSCCILGSCVLMRRVG